MKTTTKKDEVNRSFNVITEILDSELYMSHHYRSGVMNEVRERLEQAIVDRIMVELGPIIDDCIVSGLNRYADAKEDAQQT